MFRQSAGEEEHHVRGQEGPEQSMVVCRYEIHSEIRKWSHPVAGRLRGASARGSRGRKWDTVTDGGNENGQAFRNMNLEANSRGGDRPKNTCRRAV